MSDELRDRIIAALLSEEDIVLMAEAVIETLGLRRQVTDWRGDEPFTFVCDGECVRQRCDCPERPA